LNRISKGELPILATKTRLSDERMNEIAEYFASHGTQETLSIYGIKEDTLKRYLRDFRKSHGKEAYENTVLAGKMRNKYSKKEIESLVNDKSTGLNEINTEIVKLRGSNSFKFAVFSDLHLGSIFTSDSFVREAIKYINDQEIDFLAITGDVTEGMSNRDGHVYELSHIGYAAQKEYAISLLSQIKHKIFAISGNHDLWYYKQMGARVVKDICDAIPNATFLGEDFATLRIPNGPDIGLWHGGSDGGGSYARSYRMQKIIESIDVECRPQILLTGHDHKYVSLFTGGVYGLGCGSMQSQSNWMKGKRLEANTGFIMAETSFEKKNIVSFNHTFIRPMFLEKK
jgi:predicted phosphodiesterase